VTPSYGGVALGSQHIAGPGGVADTKVTVMSRGIPVQLTSPTLTSSSRPLDRVITPSATNPAIVNAGNLMAGFSPQSLMIAQTSQGLAAMPRVGGLTQGGLVFMQQGANGRLQLMSFPAHQAAAVRSGNALNAAMRNQLLTNAATTRLPMTLSLSETENVVRQQTTPAATLNHLRSAGAGRILLSSIGASSRPAARAPLPVFLKPTTTATEGRFSSTTFSQPALPTLSQVRWISSTRLSTVPSSSSGFIHRLPLSTVPSWSATQRLTMSSARSGTTAKVSGPIGIQGEATRGLQQTIQPVLGLQQIIRPTLDVQQIVRPAFGGQQITPALPHTHQQTIVRIMPSAIRNFNTSHPLSNIFMSAPTVSLRPGSVPTVGRISLNGPVLSRTLSNGPVLSAIPRLGFNIHSGTTPLSLATPISIHETMAPFTGNQLLTSRVPVNVSSIPRYFVGTSSSPLLTSPLSASTPGSTRPQRILLQPEMYANLLALQRQGRLNLQVTAHPTTASLQSVAASVTALPSSNEITRVSSEATNQLAWLFRAPDVVERTESADQAGAVNKIGLPDHPLPPPPGTQ